MLQLLAQRKTSMQMGATTLVQMEGGITLTKVGPDNDLETYLETSGISGWDIQKALGSLGHKPSPLLVRRSSDSILGPVS